MSRPNLPAMKTNPKFVFFTDFDGTITQSDSNDFLTDTIGFGQALRKQGNADVLNGKRSFRDSFQEMMDSIKTPYNECIDLLLKSITLDPGFKEFHEWATQNNVPIVVLSSGMEPIIRALLKHLVGASAEDILIISNNVASRDGKDINSEGGWKIVFHDDSHFGHDKSLAIRPYAALPEHERPTLFYAGDGVSDLSAAKETDLLFAKKGHDLIKYCLREHVPFTEFEDWTSISSTVKDIVNGKTTLKKVAAAGAHEAENAEASSTVPTVK